LGDQDIEASTALKIKLQSPSEFLQVFKHPSSRALKIKASKALQNSPSPHQTRRFFDQSFKAPKNVQASIKHTSSRALKIKHLKSFRILQIHIKQGASSDQSFKAQKIAQAKSTSHQSLSTKLKKIKQINLRKSFKALKSNSVKFAVIFAKTKEDLAVQFENKHQALESNS